MKVILFLLLAFIGVPSSYALDNCTTIDSCQECVDASCHWVQCYNIAESCQQNLPGEGCHEVSCNTTTTTAEPPTTETTTTEPTTTETPPETTTETPTEPTTTEPATTPSTMPPETTVQPTTTTSETPTTEAPTSTTSEPSTIVPSTTPSPCPGHHFDAGSFFGGIFLAVGVLVVSYAGLRFYRARNGRNYNQLQTVY